MTDFETGLETGVVNNPDTVGVIPTQGTIYLPNDQIIDGKLVQTLVDHHMKYYERYKILQGYYEGYSAILKRSRKGKKSNNKLIAPYPSYIVDILLGMFVGKPISYSSDEDLIEILQEIFDANEEQDENTEIAKMAGIKGRAYELVYLNEEGKIQFNELEPENVIYVKTTDINPRPLMALYVRKRFTLETLEQGYKEAPKSVTLYTDTHIYQFEENTERGGFELFVEPEPHNFGQVPVIEYMNNDEGLGDFERLLSYIDAYNKSQSDTANDFEEFTDALLLLGGMLGANSKQIRDMVEDGVLLTDNSDGSKQSAEWLIKNINDSALENYKSRLDSDIHKFAKVPNMGDESFAGNVTGEAMKYKLLALDQVIASKQRKFKTGLQKRIELILTIVNIQRNCSFSYKDVDIIFNDNKPINEKDNVEKVKQLSEIVSKSTALSELYFMEDVNSELQKIEEEKDPYVQELLNYRWGDDSDELDESVSDDKQEAPESN